MDAQHGPRDAPGMGREDVAAGLGLLVGAGAAVAPGALARAYGLGPLGGGGALGWRLFAGRNLLLAAAALQGRPWARQAVLALQLPDQAAFAHGLATGALPRRSALLAMATSAAVAALAWPQAQPVRASLGAVSLGAVSLRAVAPREASGWAATRSARARATRDRIVPTGTSQASAASA